MTDIITIEEEVINVTVVEEPIIVTIASVGEQGPPGTGALPSGGDADEVVTKIDSVEQNAEWRVPDGRSWESATADLGISALKVVRRTATGVAIALASDFDQLKAAVGIAKTAAIVGNSLTYQMFGEMTDGSWSWTAGDVLFVDDSGDISATPGTHLRPIGVAVSATTILIDIGLAIRR